jgi:transcription elongation factor GreB
VTYAEPDGTEQTITIVGMDEVDPGRGFVSWISPVARALLKAREGDIVLLRLPQGNYSLEILSVAYRAID